MNAQPDDRRGTNAGDVDYERHGGGYAVQRQTDPRIAAYIHKALGAARTVLNVGAGAGSYEPIDRDVLAVEPSLTMRQQRPTHLTPAINAVAESLPLDDKSVEASMATITVHQWSDLERGLSEFRRVTRGPVIVLTFDGDALNRFWLADYAPELIAVEQRRFPAIASIQHALGGESSIQAIPVPVDCIDGFAEAYYARPERFLDCAVRQSQSAWTFLDQNIADQIVERLRADLDSGEWDRRYGEWRTIPEFEGSLRLILSRP